MANSPKDTMDPEASSLADYFLTTQNTTSWQRLKAAFITTFTPFNVLYVGGGVMDYVSSVTGAEIIYSSGWLGYSEDKDDAPPADYTQLVLTIVGGACLLVVLLFRNYRKEDVKSLSYQKRSFKKLGYKNLGVVYKKNFLEDVRPTYYQLLSKGKVVNRVNQTKQYKNAAYLGNAYRINNFYRGCGLLNGKFALSERSLLFNLLGSDYDLHKQEYKRTALEKTIVAISLIIKKIWDYLNDLAFIYWLVWFSFAAFIGFSAASISPVYAPIIVGVTIGLGLLYIAPRIMKLLYQLTKNDTDIIKARNKYKQKKELLRMGTELKYRHFMKVEHDLNKTYLMDLGARKPFRQKNPVNKDKPLIILHRQKSAVQNSRLAQYFFANSRWEKGIAIATDVVNAIMMVSFILWLVSAIEFALKGIVSVVSSYDVQAGLGLAGFFGFLKYTEMQTRELHLRLSVHEKLCEQYKDTNETKLEYFEKVEKSVEFNKMYAEWLRLRVLLKEVRDGVDYRSTAFFVDAWQLRCSVFNPAISVDQHKKDYAILRAQRIKIEKRLQQQKKCPSDAKYAAQYDLEKIDVYNHEYREKQRYHAGWKTKIKIICNRAYTFIGGGRTGSMLARSFFMSGALFGGIAAGVSGMLPVLLGIALAVTAIYAGICLMQYILEREYKHRESFLKNMDGNISYLRKKEKELQMMNAYLVRQAREEKTTPVAGRSELPQWDKKNVQVPRASSCGFTLMGKHRAHRAADKVECVPLRRMTV
jgi:hypothetical protein